MMARVYLRKFPEGGRLHMLDRILGFGNHFYIKFAMKFRKLNKNIELGYFLFKKKKCYEIKKIIKI